MKIRILLFLLATVVKELLTAWFLFSRGVFHLSHITNIVVAVAAAVLMAAIVIGLVRVSSAAHSDPDAAWIGWVRFILWAGISLFATALVLVQPLSGAPALALVLVVGWVAVNERRRERAAADAQRMAMPTVPTSHADVARARYRQFDDRGTLDRQVGPDRSGLVDGSPQRGRRTERVLTFADGADTIHRTT